MSMTIGVVTFPINSFVLFIGEVNAMKAVGCVCDVVWMCVCCCVGVGVMLCGCVCDVVCVLLCGCVCDVDVECMTCDVLVCSCY